jgi:cytochrome b involved in lipid metabolism
MSPSSGGSPCPECNSKGDLNVPDQAVPNKSRLYTRCEVARHNSGISCWLIAHDKVYDVTDFLDLHPAGAKAILKKAGTDATRDFDFHSDRATSLFWRKYEIGRVKPCANHPSSNTCALM